MRTTSEEVKLLEKCLKGNSQAFEAIVAEYQDLVCAITYSGVADVQQSEELAHQTFVNAWKNLSQLKDLARFRSWLCTIARNNIRNFLKKNRQDIPAKAKPMEYTNHTAAEGCGPLESAIKKEYEKLVGDAIKEIPGQYREPLVLYYRREQSVRQVALSLGLSEDVVRQRLHRGRKMIKDRLSSIVEETLSASGPKKAFTTAVIASIAGLAIKGSGVAAAAGATGLMSSLTAKIVTAAVAVAIGVGAVVAYKHAANPGDEPEMSQAGMTTQNEQNQDNVIEQTAAQTSAFLEAASDNTLAQNVSLSTQETDQTRSKEQQAPAANVMANLSDSPYDYFLFTLLCHSKKTRTLTSVEVTDDGFKLQKIDTNSYASYGWKSPLSVIDGILYAIRGSSLQSINLPAGQSGPQPATPEDYACEVINFGLRPAHVYADGVLYGHVRKGENTRICRVLDLKKKAYRDIGPFSDDWDAPGYSNLPLAVSPDHKRVAFFEEDPNGLLVTVLQMNSGEVVRPDKHIKLIMPWIASSRYLPPLVWLDTERVLTIRTQRDKTAPDMRSDNAVNKLTCFDITTGEIEDILSLPGNAHIGFAPTLIQDYVEPGPRVCMRQHGLGDYRLDSKAGRLVEDDKVRGDYSIYEGYLFHNETELGPAERRNLRVSPDAKRAVWIRDGKLLFHDAAANTIPIAIEGGEAEGVLLWFTEADMRAAAGIESPPEGWIAFKDHRQPESKPPARSGTRRKSSSKSLALALQIDKVEYLLHEPIRITVELTNISNDDINVRRPLVIDSSFRRVAWLNLHAPSQSKWVCRNGVSHDHEEEEILLKAGETVSATELLEVAKIGDYRLEYRFKGVKDDRYRGDIKAEPAAFSVRAVEDPEKEKRLFEAKFVRLMEKFNRELEIRPGWSGANDTVGDDLVGIPGMGPSAAPYLIEALNQEEHENARNLLFRALTKVADERSLPFFRDRLMQGESEAPSIWIYDLYRKKRDAKEPPDEPLTALLSGMNHEEAEVRRDVTRQLARIYDPRVIASFEKAVHDTDQEVQVDAARYLAAAEHLDLTEWLKLASQAPTYARYIAARSIINQLETKWNITKKPIPDLSKEDFTGKSENLKSFSKILDEWQEWATENPRFSFYFFENDRTDWLAKED